MVGVDSNNAGTSDLKCNSSTDEIMGTPGRRRSLSLASAQPSVETVVVKAKRAATTLWTLLHAKNCVLANGCIHLGCREAKCLLLHLKTCPAGEGFSCPSSRHGCDQARKLLGHYRRCRNARVRQVGQIPPSIRRDQQQQQQPVCLVCSLVARHTRSLLDQPGSASSHLRASLLSSSSSSLLSSASAVAMRPTPATVVAIKKSNRRAVTTFMLNDVGMVMPPPTNVPFMPPPPPRTISMPPVPTFCQEAELGEVITKPLCPPHAPHPLSNLSSSQEYGCEGMVGHFQDTYIPGIRISSRFDIQTTAAEEETAETNVCKIQQDTQLRRSRSMSDSVGDTRLLFSTYSLDSACDTINEEPLDPACDTIN